MCRRLNRCVANIFSANFFLASLLIFDSLVSMCSIVRPSARSRKGLMNLFKILWSLVFFFLFKRGLFHGGEERADPPALWGGGGQRRHLKIGTIIVGYYGAMGNIFLYLWIKTFWTKILDNLIYDEINLFCWFIYPTQSLPSVCFLRVIKLLGVECEMGLTKWNILL